MWSIIANPSYLAAFSHVSEIMTSFRQQNVVFTYHTLVRSVFYREVPLVSVGGDGNSSVLVWDHRSSFFPG